MSKHLRIWLFVLLGTLLTSSSLLAEGVITMTTSKAVGETIKLNIEANGNVTIEGAQEIGQADEYGQKVYTIENQTITIQGDVTTLKCYSNQLTSLNVSGSTALTTLYCGGNQLTSLDLSGCTALTKLGCSDNPLTSINLSGCQLLKKFSWSDGRLISLNVSGCNALTSLECSFNQLTSLNVSGCSALTVLDCSANQLTSLDVSGCTALTALQCSFNQLTSLDVSGCTALGWLQCFRNQLTSLDVSGCTALTELTCYENQLTSLNVSGCTALTELTCSANQLTSLNVSGCTALTKLDCSSNQLTSLDVSNHNALTTLDCSKNLLRKIELSGCTSIRFLTCHVNQFKASEMANLVNSLPDLQGKGVGLFKVFYDGSGEGNVCLATHVATAKAKSWKTQFTRDWDYPTWYDYTGADNPVFVVTSSSTSGGAISFTGADNLNAVPYGTELTVVATPAEGYKLTTLTANGQDILQTKRFKVTANTRVEATFTLQAYNVTTIKLGEGTLYVTGADDLDAVTPGTELTVTATPAEGYELTELTANDRNILDTKKVVVNEDLIIKAIFSQKTFKVSLTKHGNGTIKAIGADDLNAVPYGTELTIEATPAAGSELTALVAGGINIIETKKVTIKKETTIEAFFTTQSFAVTLSKEGEGTLSATGAEDLDAVDYGTELTIVATPAAGYELTALTANGTDILATKKVTVREALDIKATFSNKTFAVSLKKVGEGTITATGAGNLNAVAYGTELTINATPAAGYKLVSLTANGTDITSSKKVVVKENLTVKATFAKKMFAVTLTKEGEGKVDATGAGDLTAVPYGTELTIVATPAMGYELVSLEANGVDITSSKRVVVRENLTVKATFSNKTFAVSLTKVGKGTITATGASNLNAVAYGTELTINATPATGYELVSLEANGVDITATKRVVVTGNLTVKATFSKKTFAVTLTKVGEGTVTATGASNLNAVAYGTELTINATPAAGYELVSLEANGVDITATKRVVVTDNLTVTAIFSNKTYAVTLTKVGEGTITATGAGDLNAVAYGTELTIVATPATGYELVSLVANGVDITATKRVVVTGNLTVKATFSNKTFAVSLTKVGEGTITATGASNLNAVAYGTELTINATPAEGYELTALTANGTDITASKKVVVKENLSVKATFAKKTFAVSLTKVGEGTITATGASNLNAVAYGTELTINATPATGYELVSLEANGVDITATKRVVVTGNLTVKVTFSNKTFAVSLTKVGEGTITATGAGNLNAVAYGTELTINATPARGYELVSITANGTDITSSKKIVVKENLTVKATFAKKSFAVSLTKVGEGTITATGAGNLNAVAYGTELTIVATPATGYELISLTANGADITATKRVVVKDNVTVKATFTKKTFAVSLTKDGEGSIIATGASNLNSVPYGTELTIIATPAMGYELVSLTANGTDITSSKKVVVTENLSVKATFAKKMFAVTLTHDGEGKVDATGAEDLTAVPYGTELTIKAMPKQGYELTALTANNKDILATRKVVVTENLTIKATFAQKTFVVTLDKEGEGVLDATGADDLKAVPYGTKLAITATPAEGYELTGLLANGFDILSTKSVEVTGDTKIKAIFTQQTFAVTLTSNEHGEITIVEPVDLDAVPYGTTLTVKATGKNAQCELTALTANGEDILATKSFVVKGATEVKATFVDHTGVETTVTQQVKLYPNPATDYVIVEGVAPASEVTLHSMTGERLYAGRADSRGVLRIDLTPYANGVYLVCVAGETYRVVVRH